MREVSCKATRLLLEAVGDVDLDSLVKGLPVSLAELRDPTRRIDWDLFAELLARVEALCGDTLRPEDIGVRMLKAPSFDFLRHAGQLLVSPKHLYEVAQRLVAPALFPTVISHHEWLPSGRLLITIELPRGYRESTTFFRICHGNIAVLPRLLDLPASTIEEQAFSGSRSRLVLLPPASHTLVARIQRGARALTALGDAWRGIVRQQRELETSLVALQSSRHELKQLIQRLPDGVLIQRDGVVCWANAALVEILGASRLEDVVGRPVLDLVPPEDREPIAHAMRRASTNEVSDGRHEYRVLRPDGTLRRVQAGTAQVVDFEGAPARLVVLRDVTEHHRLREQAAISDRLASIGALAAGVAHEINNPLAYVRLSLEIAEHEVATLADPTLTSELRASLARAREGTERVLGIVRDLKTLSRVHDEPSEAVDVTAVLDATLALGERAIGTKARVVRSYGPVPHALAPRGKLGQVFLNLLTNAADAIPEGAPSNHVIRVATRADAQGRAVVEITDSGVGIASDVAARVFDPFFTTKPVGAGTGLGLAMCHRIVTELGGEIGFDSAPGATTFRVTLPAARAPQRDVAPSQHREARPPISHPRRRLLVVDDEPALLASMRRLLGASHDIVTAASARNAIEILRDDPRFDVVLADLMMADLTGMDLYAAVREHHPGLERRFVFMTGAVFTRRAEAFLAEVPNRCIEKPFELNVLLEAVESVTYATS